MSFDVASNREREPANWHAKVDEICDRFELQWQQWAADPSSGPHPEIENYVASSTDAELPRLFRELLFIDIGYRHRCNEPPTPIEYQQRFPDLDSIVSDVFASVENDLQMAGQMPEPGLAPTIDQPPANANRPSRIGKYQVEDTLGAGGQAVTYLAFDQDLRRRVVVKAYHSSGTPIEQEAVLNEGRSLARVKSRYVAQCLNVERDANQIYLVMEYIRGQSLAKSLTDRSPSFREAAQLVAHVAEGLSDVHARGLLHRDIKPGNIIVRENGIPCLVDFGLATPMAGDSLNQLGGTLQYMAPEQARCDAEQIDQRSDVFGLGAVLYRLLTGRTPFDGATKLQVWEQAKRAKFPRPSSLRSDIPTQLGRICLRSMAVEPTDRFKSANAMGRALRRYLRTSAKDAQTPSKDVGPNPYKGLAAFTEDDAHLFFGRDEQIERLWDAFRDLHTPAAIDAGQPRVLTILGPSGSGKSSLARAGLIAELKRRPLPDHEHSRFITLSPGAHPLESLAAVLARAVTNDAAPIERARQFETQLKTPNSDGQYYGLRRIAALLSVDDGPVVLLIDQFEEVFSICKQSDERNAFIESLLCAASDAAACVSVILTLRSDFISATQDQQSVNVLVSQQGVIVPAMTDVELRRAIAQPAQQVGHPLDESVIELLVQEAKDREGALPLLQFTLARIWEGLRDGKNPAETWKEIGGVGGALAGEADRIFDDLSTQDQGIARRAFLAMVQLGEGARDTRRRTSLASVAAEGADDQHVHRVVSQFASARTRLVTLSAAPDGSHLAEMTHEALLDHWPRLRGWLDEYHQDIRFQRRVEEAARHWSNEGRPEGLLWRAPDLDYLRQFQQRAASEMSATQLQFFSEADQKDKQEKLRARRRIHFYQATAVVVTLLACAAMFFGIRSQQDAIRAERTEGTAINTLLILARSAQERLAELPGDEVREVRKQLITTARAGLDEIGNGMQEGTSKAIITATANRFRGDVHMEEGEFAQALEKYEQCRLALVPTIDAPAERIQRWVTLLNLARASDGIGKANLELKDYAAAKQHFERAHQYRRQWLETGQETDWAEKAIAASALNLGRLYRRQGEPRKALEYFQELLEYRRKALQADPDSLDAQRDVAGALRAIGTEYAVLGNYEQAIENFKEALPMLQAVAAARNSDWRTAANLGLFEVDLGKAYEYTGNPTAAVVLHQQAVNRLRPLHQANAKDYGIRVYYWRALYRLATVKLESEPETAQRLFEESLQLAPDKTAWRIWTLARCHRTDEAAELADQLTAQYADKPKDLYEVACGYALCASSVKANSDGDLSEDQQQRFQEFADQAIETMKAAISSGYANSAELQNNPDLNGIRHLPAFESLLQEVQMQHGLSGLSTG